MKTTLGVAFLWMSACNTERLYVSNESGQPVVLKIDGRDPMSLPAGFKGGSAMKVTGKQIRVVVETPAGVRSTLCPIPANTDVVGITILPDLTLDCGGS